MTTSASGQPYIARGPVDLIAMAPQVIGFHPEDSVVLMTFGEVGRAFHARVDLPVDVDLQEQVAEVLVTAVQRNGPDRAAVLLYSTDRDAALRQGRVLLERLLDAGVAVIDVLRVEKRRFYYPLEGDQTGTPYDVGAHPFTARSVFEGRVVEESREALAGTLVGGDDADRAVILASATDWADRMLRHVGEPTGSRARARHAEALWIQGRVRRFLRTRQPLTGVQAGQLLGCAGVITLRDVAWAEITRRNAATQVELWRDMVRRAPEELVVAPAALLAFAAWLAGDGALAWCAIDRYVEVDPDYSMADCVAGMLLRAIPPSRWPGIAAAELEALDPPADPRRAG